VPRAAVEAVDRGEAGKVVVVEQDATVDPAGPVPGHPDGPGHVAPLQLGEAPLVEGRAEAAPLPGGPDAGEVEDAVPVGEGDLQVEHVEAQVATGVGPAPHVEQGKSQHLAVRPTRRHERGHRVGRVERRLQPVRLRGRDPAEPGVPEAADGIHVLGLHRAEGHGGRERHRVDRSRETGGRRRPTRTNEGLDPS
jgi:hypothetical protein